LLVRYDVQQAGATLTKAAVKQRKTDLSRYAELLPIGGHEHFISLGEHTTPILALKKFAERTGFRALFVKDESLLPTGTFKSRGACIGVSRAKELGVQTIAMPSNGNAGAAWAAYAARAGIAAWIVMPRAAPRIHRIECVLAGAHLLLVDGLIGDAARSATELIAQRGFYDASTLKEPYRIEGKKTIGFEIAEQFDWDLPDVIICPTGGGVGLIGIYKALQELKELGWIGDSMPRLVAVQAANCAPIVRAWRARATESMPWHKASTLAFGINVPKALGDFLVLAALYSTQGTAVAVEDPQMLQTQRDIGETEGLIVCMEGAAAFAAAVELRRSGWIGQSERVLVVNTGTGLKSHFGFT
jgi:threonine synthase